jgi:hypothetical protein
MQQESVLAAEGVVPVTVYRVMVCLNDETINESSYGSVCTGGSKNGELLVLRILEASELLPASFQRKQGEREWERIVDRIGKLRCRRLRYWLSDGPNQASGIQATAREFTADFLLVEWRKKRRAIAKESPAKPAVLSAKPVAILKVKLAINRKNFCCLRKRDHGSGFTNGGCSLQPMSPLEAVKIFRKSESQEIASESIQETITRAGIQLCTNCS